MFEIDMSPVADAHRRTMQAQAARRDELRAQAQELVDSCEETGMTVEQDAKFGELMDEIKAIDADFEARERAKRAFADLRPELQSKPGVMQFRHAASGEIVSAVSGDQKLHQPPPRYGSAEPETSVGDLIHGMLSGQPIAAQFGGSDSSGGYVISPSYSQQVLDLARSASVAMQAGALTVPMTTSELHLTRLASDPTSTWRPEGVAVNSSTMTFDKVILRAKTLAAIVPVSIEMLEDSSNARSVIEMALQASMGQSLDSAVLAGTGAESQPKGIRNHDDVNEVASVGTPANYDKVSTAVGKILTANFNGDPSSLAWVSHPRDGETFDQLKDTTNQPLRPSKWVGDLRRFSTTALPTTEGGSSNESVGIVGDFSQVLVGMRTSGVNIRILDSGTVTDSSGDTFNAASQLGRLIVAYLRADVVLMRPTWLCNLTGITA